MSMSSDGCSLTAHERIASAGSPHSLPRADGTAQPQGGRCWGHSATPALEAPRRPPLGGSVAADCFWAEIKGRLIGKGTLE